MHYKINIKQYKFLWCFGHPYVIYPSLLIVPMHLFYSPLPKCSLFSIYHIFFALLFLSLELPTLHHGPFPFSFFSGCYYWLHTSTQRFRAKTHKKERTCDICFLGLGYSSQYNMVQFHLLPWKDLEFIFSPAEQNFIVYTCSIFSLSINLLKSIYGVFIS